jgi:GAF domain-containing protein
MRRRAKTGGGQTASRSTIKIARKRRSRPTARRRASVLSAGDEELRRQLEEAHQQQTATADVLKVISRSKFDLQTVLDTVTKTAARVCQADHSFIFLGEGDVYRCVAGSGHIPEYINYLKQQTIQPSRGTVAARALLEGRTVHIPDVLSDPEYTFLEAQRRGEFRTALGVPLLREGVPIGVIALTRPTVWPFDHSHIALVTTFADQAVIAIENARLLNELRESLQQQTATADVLKVISRSTFDLQPVFDSMAESAVRLCEAERAYIFRFDGEMLRAVASFNAGPENQDWVYRNPIPLGRHSVSARAGLERRTVQVADIQADPEYHYVARDVDPIRTTLAVPMLKGDELIGTITIYRLEVRPFSSNQIALMETFADQAVIAIENVRLFEAEQQRTRELTESLERQTATSEVLRVISSSSGKLEPVFQAMLENAVKICGAKFGNLFLREGKGIRIGATYGAPQTYVNFLHSEGALQDLHPDVGVARLVRTKEPYQVTDLAASPTLGDKLREATIELAGARTLIGVPMLKDGQAIGAIIIYRQEIKPFADKQIELVQNFAAQAVIAIENTRLLNELRESLEQQTATSEVLRVISTSPGELTPVFEAMLANATRICQASFGSMLLRDGDGFRRVAIHNPPPQFADFNNVMPIVRGTVSVAVRRATEAKQIVHMNDVRTEDPEDPLAKFAGARTLLIVPLLKDNQVLGVFGVYRQEVRPFADKQIELVQNFAAQAVIAIENARLLQELRESLDQQTATSEVLKVIASSTGELAPVFSTMLENAARLCEASYGAMWLRDGDGWRAAAMHGDLPAAYLDRWRSGNVFKIGPDVPMARVLATRQPVHVPDMREDAGYLAGDRLPVSAVEEAGIRTQFSVPMMRDEEVVGVITIYRREVRPFGKKQIELIQNFAAQAVIAIENARLLNELRQRTDDLSEALEQQTATSEVLSVISGSAGDLEPVFNAMLANATHLCGASYGVMFLCEGDDFRTVAIHGSLSEAFLKQWERGTVFRPDPELPALRAVKNKQVMQVADLRTTPAYLRGDPLPVSAADVAGIRSMLTVPMLKDGVSIGVIAIYRKEVLSFTDKQVALVTNFAAQAVIAIENARLLNELRESLERQTATADVLKVISRSAFDLRVVLDTLLRSAGRLCEADMGVIARRQDDRFYRTVAYGLPNDLRELIDNQPVELSRDSGSGRALLEGKVVQIPDIEADKEYTHVSRGTGGFHTLLGVPMMREGVPVGVMTLMRREVLPFTEKQVELVSTFADQAAIAIENVRLFEAEQQRTRELVKSLDDLRTAQDRLVQTQKLASLGQLTAGIAHEIKNPLNFVNNFSGLSVELIDELQDALGSVKADDKTLGEITELATTLRGNLDKIAQHGKRADSIVKNMLLHSREGSGEQRAVDINAIVEESLSLAYHGARAEKQDFEIALQRSFDPDAGEAELYPQEISRALLNFISNGFYAATKRQREIGDGYEPTLAAATKNLGDRVEIRIRDNGAGIPPEVKEKIFNPFFTTKPAGEGTGLGLSISHDIIVKQHLGSIEVDSAPGEFTEIRIVLPRTASPSSKPGG